MDTERAMDAGHAAAVLQHSREQLPAMLDDALSLIRRESPSADLDAVARSAAHIATTLGAHLGPAETIVIDGVAHLRWQWGQTTRILILAHHDTVWPVGSLADHPAQASDTALTGPGSLDMAIGIVQAAHALRLVSERHGSAAWEGVTMLVTGDEEVGSATSRALIEEHARTADAVLVLEAAGPDGALKTVRKGVSQYRIDITGRAAHAGLEPERGINAGVELARLSLWLTTLSDPELGTTVTPTAGRIGTTVNTVPAAAHLEVDVRATTTAELERIDHAIHDYRPQTSSVIHVDGGINRPPLEHSMSAPLFARAAALAAAAGIGRLHECSVGGASDGNVTAGLGVPTLDGLGGVGGGAHADDEHVLIEHIAPRTALVALLLEDLLELA